MAEIWSTCPTRKILWGRASMSYINIKTALSVGTATKHQAKAHACKVSPKPPSQTPTLLPVQAWISGLPGSIGTTLNMPDITRKWCKCPLMHLWNFLVMWLLSGNYSTWLGSGTDFSSSSAQGFSLGTIWLMNQTWNPNFLVSALPTLNGTNQRFQIPLRQIISFNFLAPS